MGTPRQACNETNAVSSAHAAVNAPSRMNRAPRVSGTNDATQVTVNSVTPNDSPKVIGLRSDNGPIQDVPLTRIRAAKWTMPLTINAAATT